MYDVQIPLTPHRRLMRLNHPQQSRPRARPRCPAFCPLPITAFFPEMPAMGLCRLRPEPRGWLKGVHPCWHSSSARSAPHPAWQHGPAVAGLISVQNHDLAGAEARGPRVAAAPSPLLPPAADHARRYGNCMRSSPPAARLLLSWLTCSSMPVQFTSSYRTSMA